MAQNGEVGKMTSSNLENATIQLARDKEEIRSCYKIIQPYSTTHLFI